MKHGSLYADEKILMCLVIFVGAVAYSGQKSVSGQRVSGPEV